MEVVRSLVSGTNRDSVEPNTARVSLVSHVSCSRGFFSSLALDFVTTAQTPAA